MTVHLNVLCPYDFSTTFENFKKSFDKATLYALLLKKQQKQNNKKPKNPTKHPNREIHTTTTFPQIEVFFQMLSGREINRNIFQSAIPTITDTKSESLHFGQLLPPP